MRTKNKIMKITMLILIIIPMSFLTITVDFTKAADVILVPENYSTIQDAVDAANPGDTILVGPGEYAGAFISKPLTIIGEGAETIINDPLWGIAGFYIAQTDGVVIEGFTIIDCITGILGSNSNEVTITKNVIINSLQAITNGRGSNWKITYNKIQGLLEVPYAPSSGIILIDACNNLVFRNDIKYVSLGDEIAYCAGIALIYTGDSFPEKLTTGNRIIANSIEIYVPEDLHSAGILVIDYSALNFGDPILLTDNLIVGNYLRDSFESVALCPYEIYDFNIIHNTP